jgi:aconitate hydratase
MMRGTFANVRIKNRLVAPKEGGFTVKFPEKEEGYVFDIAMQYLKEGRNLIVLGKKEYGSGSSRDWAAKGTVLLGVKAVIAESFERIHKSNLVGMGVLPLQFREGQSYESLGISGNEKFSILGLGDLKPGQILKVIAEKEDGAKIEFEALSRLDTEIEVEYYKSGGILPYVLKKFVG